MRWQVWRIAAIVFALSSLTLVIATAVAPFTTQGFRSVPAARPALARRRVTALLPERDVQPDLRVGDVIRLHDDTLAERARYARERPGEAFVFDRAGRTPLTVRIVSGPTPPVVWILLALDLSFISMGALLALRRPMVGEVRALAAFLLVFGADFLTGPEPWMPLWLVVLATLVAFPLQMAACATAVELATTFPDPAAGGLRRFIRRSNYVVSPLFAALGAWSSFSALVGERALPDWAFAVGSYPWVYYVVAIAAAFTVANRNATGADRRRARWVSFTLAVAFSGVVLELALIVIARIPAERVMWLQLSLVALPFGLGYAIVRHRVVDIGFVVNRALVFAIVSGIVLLAFGALEWLLGNILVAASHITSASLELGLALVLGFSLRSIHARVDALVDDLFFRDRHRAERALRTFAREVAYVTDPRVAIARTREVLVACGGASSVSIYVSAGATAVRVDPAGSPAAARVDVDDPALVRMRATRSPVGLQNVDSALNGDRAFPMLARDEVTGTVVLGAKDNGEAYAPDEIATIENVVLALGQALDALQTAALRAEVSRVLGNRAPVESLRAMVSAAAWLDAGLSQPAGSALGLGE